MSRPLLFKVRRGEFAARTADGRLETLESFSTADFSLYQGTNKVNLKPGATAGVELLLPQNTRLQRVTLLRCGISIRPAGCGRKKAAGVSRPRARYRIGSRPSPMLRHFSWWNSDQVIDVAEVRGRVVDQVGNPLAGVNVSGNGVDYAGLQLSGGTERMLQVTTARRSGGLSQLAAGRRIIQGIHLVSVPQQVQAGAAGSLCANGSAAGVADLVLPIGLACVSGTVVDGAGQPAAGRNRVRQFGLLCSERCAGRIPGDGGCQNARQSFYAAGYPAASVMAPAAAPPAPPSLCSRAVRVPGLPV